MTELILIRHGETDWNRQMRFQGHIDVPLNAAGQAQAARLAERLAREPLQVLVSSDLLRARQTAAPLAARLGLALVADAGLREQGFGELEGLRTADVQRERPEVWAAWSRHDQHYAVPGGESTHGFHERVLAAVQRLAACSTCCGARRRACRCTGRAPARSPTAASTGCASTAAGCRCCTGPTTPTCAGCPSSPARCRPACN